MFSFDKPLILIRKMRMLKFSNQYEILDEETLLNVGLVTEDISIATKLSRTVMNKANLSNHLIVSSTEEGLAELFIDKPSSFLSAKIQVFDSDNIPIGYFLSKYISNSLGIVIYDVDDNEIATITTDWKAWNYEIKTPKGTLIGTVKKIWKGIFKELILNIDSYRIEFFGSTEINTEQQNLVFAASLSISTVYRIKG